LLYLPESPSISVTDEYIGTVYRRRTGPATDK